jgi:hypothetical protein
LAQVALGQAKAGNFMGAMETADGIQDSNARASTFRAVGKAQGEKGETGPVIAWTAKQVSPVKRTYVPLGLAEGMLLARPSSR